MPLWRLIHFPAAEHNIIAKLQSHIGGWPKLSWHQTDTSFIPQITPQIRRITGIPRSHKTHHIRMCYVTLNICGLHFRDNTLWIQLKSYLNYKTKQNATNTNHPARWEFNLVQIVRSISCCDCWSDERFIFANVQICYILHVPIYCTWCIYINIWFKDVCHYINPKPKKRLLFAHPIGGKDLSLSLEHSLFHPSARTQCISDYITWEV